MRSVLTCGMCACFVLLTACFSKPSAADAPSTVAGCANPALPASILPDSATPNAAARQAGIAPLMVEDVEAPHKSLVLAVASDESSRELGLMCVLRLRPQHGMLFVFGGNAKQEFWMKNTLIPLDMVWVRADGTVDTVAANVPASTRTTPNDRVARRDGTGKYVIELSAGEAATDGIQRGARLSIPATP